MREKTPHGKICIAFTPDEEVGGGAQYLKIKEFGAAYGYTLDGSHEGEIQFENFNAAGAEVTVHGVNVHPGSAKDIMKNAQTSRWRSTDCFQKMHARRRRKGMKDSIT